jgi:hypothetical protein
MQKKETYETSSLPLASFLFYSGVPLLEVCKDKHQNKKIFVFERVNGLDQILEVYFRKMARVEPETYFFAIKSLKVRLYDFNDDDG